MITLRSVLIALLCAAPSLAQHDGVVQQSFGIHATDGVVRAGGPEWSARFDERGVEFVPVLTTSERPLPVRFTLESVRRGADDVFVRTTNVTPTASGDRVRYAHRDDLAEVYDARRDGVEQSFVFATKPAGHGDLVVRGAIATDLPFVSASDDGVRFDQLGLGGVTFGAVTGVDANGATTRGSIRADADGSHVEWVLPAAFVENAAYPLVLDPLIGAAVTIAPFPQTGAAPKAAYDEATNRYLVVWTAVTSPTTDEVRAQFVGPTGATVGSMMILASGVDVVGAPRVANVNASNRFLVSWTDRATPTSLVSRIQMRSVAAGTGALSATVLVASGTVDSPQVGGDSRSVFIGIDYACLVWRERFGAQMTIQSRGVQVFAAADPVLVGTAQTVTAAGAADISITQHAGIGGRWMCAWADSSSDAPPWQNIWCRVIGAFGVPCSAEKLLSLGGASSDVRNTACATRDGGEFVVAWEDAVAADIHVRPITWNGPCPGVLTLGSQTTPLANPGTAAQPAIEFAKDKYVLAWQRIAGGPAAVLAKGLDPVLCASCGVEHVVNTVGAPPDVASRWSGGETGSDEALITWASGAVQGRLFEATGDDAVASMGGGCVSGLNDFATYNGDAVLGNANFQLAIANSVSLPLVLVIGFSNVSVPCGGCTIVPNPDILFPATNPYTLAIPCDPLLVGVDLYTQWLVLKPSTCPLLPDFSFTNALKFTIGE